MQPARTSRGQEKVNGVGPGGSCRTQETQRTGSQWPPGPSASTPDQAKRCVHLRKIFPIVFRFLHKNSRLVQPFLWSEMQSDFSLKQRKRSLAIFIAKYFATYRRNLVGLHVFGVFLLRSHSFGPLCESPRSVVLVLLLLFFNRTMWKSPIPTREMQKPEAAFRGTLGCPTALRLLSSCHLPGERCGQNVALKSGHTLVLPW